MKYDEYFDENGWLKEEYLWPLRQQITLGSIYIADYANHFGIDANKVCDFFTSFWEGYCEELAQEDGLWEQAVALVKERRRDAPAASATQIDTWNRDAYLELQRQKYDNEDTIREWYGCYAECPLTPTYINVDIHWDFARSIRVIASSEKEAEEIVDEMMQNKEIPQNTFEPTGDYELDTNWQPE